MSDALIFLVSVLAVVWLLITSAYLAAVTLIWSSLSWGERVLMMVRIILWPGWIVVMWIGLLSDDKL